MGIEFVLILWVTIPSKRESESDDSKYNFIKNLFLKREYICISALMKIEFVLLLLGTLPNESESGSGDSK